MDYTVFVRWYERQRFGRIEYVRSHFRRRLRLAGPNGSTRGSSRSHLGGPDYV